MNKDELIHEVAKYLMIKTRGYTSENEWPMEWDITSEDSQISMVMDDIREVFRYLEGTHGYSFPKNPAPQQPPLTGSAAYTVTYNNTWSSVSTGTASWSTKTEAVEQDDVLTNVKIHLSTPEFPLLCEVEDFVQRAKDMGLTEDTRLTGRLQAHVSFSDADISLITCGDCGEDDLFITQHSCTFSHSPYDK